MLKRVVDFFRRRPTLDDEISELILTTVQSLWDKQLTLDEVIEITEKLLDVFEALGGTVDGKHYSDIVNAVYHRSASEDRMDDATRITSRVGDLRPYIQ